MGFVALETVDMSAEVGGPKSELSFGVVYEPPDV